MNPRGPFVHGRFCSRGQGGRADRCLNASAHANASTGDVKRRPVECVGEHQFVLVACNQAIVGQFEVWAGRFLRFKLRPHPLADDSNRCLLTQPRLRFGEGTLKIDRSAPGFDAAAQHQACSEVVDLPVSGENGAGAGNEQPSRQAELIVERVAGIPS